MTRKDWLLLVLSAAEGECLSPVQLQKVLYVLGRKRPGHVGENYYEFIPYNYGPFSSQIYQDLESPNLGRLVRAHRQPGVSWFQYSATKEGRDYARQLEVPDDIRGYVKKLVDWARSLSFEDLVKAVYRAYPETKANSVFRGEP